MYELLCCRLLWDSFWCRNTHLTEPSRLLFTVVWRLFFFSFPGLEEIWASVGAFPLTSDLSVSDLNDPTVWSEPLSSGPYTDEKWRRQRVRERELSVLQCQSVPFPTDICGGFFLCLIFVNLFLLLSKRLFEFRRGESRTSENVTQSESARPPATADKSPASILNSEPSYRSALSGAYQCTRGRGCSCHWLAFRFNQPI